MADYLEKLKEEYPGMFGPVGAAPAIASHEFAPIRTAGLWSDYVRPALEWVGETVPGIGRSETSDPSWRAPVHDRLKEEREAAEEYRRRSEEDMRRLEEETREYDKDFKKIGFITGEDPSAAYDVSREAWKEAVREDPSGVAVMPSPLDSGYTKFIDGRTLPFLDMPVLRPDEMTDDEIDDLISEGLDLSADDPLLSGYTPGIGPDALPETVTAMIDADMAAGLHPEVAEALPFDLSALTDHSLPHSSTLSLDDIRRGLIPEVLDPWRVAEDFSKGLDHPFVEGSLSAEGLSEADRDLAAAPLGFAGATTAEITGAPHHSDIAMPGLPHPAKSAVSGIEDATKHALASLELGKDFMDFAELPGRIPLAPLRDPSPVEPMDFMTHATVDKMVRDAAVVGTTVTADDVKAMIAADVGYKMSEAELAPTAVAAELTAGTSYPMSYTPVSDVVAMGLVPTTPIGTAIPAAAPAPVAAPIYSPPEPDDVPTHSPVYAPAELSVAPPVSVSVPASLVAEVLAPTPHLDSRTVGGMSGRERAEYEALIDAFEHGRLGGGSSGWSGGDDAGMGEWGGSDTGGGGGFGYGI